MFVTPGARTKRTSSAAELASREGVSKKPRGSDHPLDRHQATLPSEAVDVNPTTLQPEPPTTSQVQMPQSATKPLKGRRKFMADLEELKSTGFSLHGRRVNSTWNCVVSLCTLAYVPLQSCALETKKDLSSLPSCRRINILSRSISSPPVSETVATRRDSLITIDPSPDTSDYPESHQFYAFALEADGLPDHVTVVIQGIADRPSRTLQETIRRLFFDLSRAESRGESSDEHEEDSSDEDEIDGDFDYGYDTGVSQPTHFEIEQLRK